MVTTFETQFPRAHELGQSPLDHALTVERAARAKLIERQAEGRMLSGRPDGKVPAHVNHGRWIVSCPSPGCSGAQMASPHHPFVCIVCSNDGNDSQPLTVVFPKKRERIEEILEKR